MTATVVKLRTSPARLECSACGATAEAACDCGAPYVPTAAQKREAVAEALKGDPKKSDRQIARVTGVSHPTVAAVRAELEDGGKIFHHQERVGSDGVKQPAKKAARLVTAVAAQSSEPEQPIQSTPNTRFLNVAWDAEHRPNEFDFPSMTDFAELASAAERVSKSWATAAKELRRLANGK